MLLSVIIPTHFRPKFLPRAVGSALESAWGAVEVIVVPNGGDESWRDSLAPWANDKRIIISPITQANANAARNHGMALASGKFIRFLDDDDFLYPEAAKQQLSDLIRAEADISVGQVAITNADGKLLELAYQLSTADFTEAAIAIAGESTLPCALVMRKSITEQVTWDPAIAKYQDLYWAWDLIRTQELNSVRFMQCVGAWVQHSNGPRVSQGHHRGTVAKKSATRLLYLLQVLEESGRLTIKRKQAAANGLWNCIHSGIMFDPIYWYRLSHKARSLYSKSHPSTKLYRVGWLHHLNPVFIELGLIPWRWIKVLFSKSHLT